MKLSLTALHKKIFNQFLKGTPLSLVQEEVAQFLKKDFYRFLYYPTFERLRLAQHQGDHTAILSNAPSFIVGPIAEYLEVNEWAASHYTVDKEGNFEAVETILLGEDKAACINQMTESLRIDRQWVTAYSDSDLDLPFLHSAGIPVAANPNPKLLKISKKNAWEVI